MSDNDYRGVHKAPPQQRLLFPARRSPADLRRRCLRNPQYNHGGDDKAVVDMIKAARGNPDLIVTIWRAMPAAADGWFHPGDWVATSLDYARVHAIGNDIGPEHERDMPVYRLDVAARTLFSDGASLYEFGYDGPTMRGGLI